MTRKEYLKLKPHRRFDFSFSEKILRGIFKKTIVNKNSRGSDGMSAQKFEENLDSHIECMNRKVLVGSYKFSPYVELQISKGRDKAPRILSIPTIRDQVVLSALKEHLHAKFPKSVGRRLPNSYIFELMQFLRENEDPQVELGFIRADITGFYDNIDRERLMNRVRKTTISKQALQLLYRSITKPTVPHGISGKQHFRFYLSKGIPQGLAVSNILANIYMSEFDEKFERLAPLHMRYVDDILLVCPLSDRSGLMEKLRFAVAELGLTLNDSKTEVGVLGQDSFDFLGYKVMKGVRIGVRQSSIDRLINAFAALITGADHRRKEFKKRHDLDASAYQQMLIEDLNEKITGAVSHKKQYGWLYYFSQMDDMSLLHHLDKTLGQLCERSVVLKRRCPGELKSFIHAFREIHAVRKGATSDYLLSYDDWDLRSQQAFIKRHGEWPGKKRLKEDEINALFEKVIIRRMSRLDVDLKSLS